LTLSQIKRDKRRRFGTISEWSWDEEAIAFLFYIGEWGGRSRIFLIKVRVKKEDVGERSQSGD
jgi:hypothetical protein